MKYIVESYDLHGIYTTDEPEQAVAAFMREFDVDTTVSVYVADFIGKFSKVTTISRHPNQPITRPDSPKAMSTKAGPNNIKAGHVCSSVHPQAACPDCK